MKYKSVLIILALWATLVSCDQQLNNAWQSKPHINAFHEEEGVALFIKGERLSKGLEEAEVYFALNQDLISGGFKQIFTFTLNGRTNWGEDNIEVITPSDETFEFEIYDGLLFNIDYESNEVSRFIELLNYDYLEIRSGDFRFTISSKDFMNLYNRYFRQSNS